MALINLAFDSQVLGFQTEVRIFIPTPDSDEILNHKDSDYFFEGARFQTVYLLHGAYGDDSDWSSLTNIQRYAQDRKVAVVMPSAENGFYQNMFHGPAWLTYLGEELPVAMQRLFPLSKKREDNFTAGLSMGGYGAWRLALTYPEQYAAAASLSGAVDIMELFYKIERGELEGPFPWEDIFEHPHAAVGTDAELLILIERVQRKGYPMPCLFQSCGTSDFIYPINQAYHQKLLVSGVDVTYEEHPGIHDWNYWDTHIQRALDWLPLKHSSVS